MDGSTIFRGEIAKASGFLERFPETYGDVSTWETIRRHEPNIFRIFHPFSDDSIHN